jgi:hypothetical protein
MAFFRSVSLAESGPAVAGHGVILRPPVMSDFSEWAALREESRDFLTPWEPIWPTDDLTRGAFRRRLKRYAEDQRTDTAYAFLIFRESDRVMVGGLTLANLRRGVAQAGSIGYWVGHRAPGPDDGSGAHFDPNVLRHAPAASHRGGLHSEQHGFGPSAGEDRLSTRGLRARISVYQRRLGRSFTVCAAP